MSRPTEPLAGLRVVVTRPQGQGESLCQGIQAAGGLAINFPVLAILDPLDNGPLLSIIERLDQYDLAIFISPNAVNKAMNLIMARGGLPQSLKLATVGRGSGRELKRIIGRDPDIMPGDKQYNSEGLLAEPGMQDVAGQRIVIFRGDGGRELLAEELRHRGATVEYAEAYRRSQPNADIQPLLQAWARDEIDIIVITSGEGLRNLFDMVGKLGQQWLRKTPLLVINKRLGDIARQLGNKIPPVVADEASDQGIIRCLEDWWQQQQDKNQ
jgi:uroporphyrinogen-III synthase